MSSLEDLTARLQAASIAPLTLKHDAADSPAAWKDALKSTPGAPAAYELTKVLVYKPKTAKTAVPVPVVAIAGESTELNSSSLGKKLNLKELRLASEDLLKEFFSTDKNSGMFSLWTSGTVC